MPGLNLLLFAATEAGTDGWRIVLAAASRAVQHGTLGPNIRSGLPNLKASATRTFMMQEGVYSAPTGIVKSVLRGGLIKDGCLLPTTRMSSGSLAEFKQARQDLANAPYSIGIQAK